MGRLTDDMTRLVAEIHRARRGRERCVQDVACAVRAMKRRVALLRSTWAADLAGARAAWSGLTLSSGAAGVRATGRLGRRDVDAGHEALRREETEKRGRFEAEAGASARGASRKARRSSGRTSRAPRATR